VYSIAIPFSSLDWTAHAVNSNVTAGTNHRLRPAFGFEFNGVSISKDLDIFRIWEDWSRLQSAAR
jgi:hypothetical protein